MGPDGTTNYYHDGSRPIWETNSAGAMTAQYDRDTFGNLLSRRDSANVRHYFHFDALGSTTALTNASGAVSATMLYDAWGNQRAVTGSGHGNYRFTGSERDTTTGLYHMGARFYDPTVGRWLSEDPVQDKPFEPATLNVYAYVSNNPMLYVDPTGKILILPLLAAGLVAAEIALSAYDFLSLFQTLTSEASPELKLLNLGAFILGLVGPGGGYSASANRAVSEWHHIWPMYLGGTRSGPTTELATELHRAYHGFLDRSGLARRKAKEIKAIIDAGGQAPVLRQLLRLTEDFDKVYGTGPHGELLRVLRKHRIKF